ncbi:hypothetical protein GW17_00057960 [Ensete ventricosum]|nr:hypothetical protein GW17_00057960 [Ensete ventricosum]
MHKGVCQKKTKTHRKIIGGSRKACRDSLGDSPKGSRSSLRIRWEIAGRRPEDSLQECRRLPDSRDNGCTTVAQVFRQLMVADPPRLGG